MDEWIDSCILKGGNQWRRIETRHFQSGGRPALVCRRQATMQVLQLYAVWWLEVPSMVLQDVSRSWLTSLA